MLSSTPDERRQWAAISPERADYLLVGACVLEAVCSSANKDSLWISDGGVRLEMAIMHAKLGNEQAMRALSRTFPEDPSLGEQALFGPALRVELPAPEVLFEGKSTEERTEDRGRGRV